MKRSGVLIATLWLSTMVLTACQGKTPTAPGSTGGSEATTAPVSGVNDGSSYDDEVRAQLTASPTTIQQGQYSTLTWTTDEAEDVYLNGVRVDRSGSKNVYPTATTTYTLVAVHDDHRATSSVTVTVSGGTSSDDEVRAQLTASPTTIQPGQYSTLTWDTHDADDVYLNGVPVDKDGSKNVYPSVTTTYTLVAVDGDHRATASVTVTVSGTAPAPDPMPTATFAVTPTSIQAGQSCTLTWDTTNATSVTLNGNAVSLDGTLTRTPTATTTYTLVATNAAGSITKTATVTVTAAPPTVPLPTASLSANPTTITAGQSSTLTWNTTDATSVTMNGSPVAASGTQSYSPTTTTTYTLVATNSTGSVTRQVTVTVNAVQPPPAPMPTASLTASPSSILSGSSSMLSWNTTDATTVTLNGTTVAATGMQSVSPASTTTYTLVARNATGSVTRTATVTVTAPAPAITYLTNATSGQPSIKQIMDGNCIMCHGGPSPTAGRDFSTYQGVMSVVTPGDPNSRLIQMTKPGASMHGFLSPDPAGRAQIIYDWIVLYGAKQQ
jgi:hypothetical protein